MQMWKKGENSAIYKSILPLIEDTIKTLEKKMEVFFVWDFFNNNLDFFLKRMCKSQTCHQVSTFALNIENWKILKIIIYFLEEKHIAKYGDTGQAERLKKAKG